MQKPTMLVTGATGKTGGATIAQLVTKGYPVRALVHRSDDRSEGLKKRGVQVIVGSLEDMTDLRQPCEGSSAPIFAHRWSPARYGVRRCLPQPRRTPGWKRSSR